MTLKVVEKPGLIGVIEDGFNEMNDADAQGFSYIVGEIRGGKLKIVFEPDDSLIYDSIDIDGVNGFGYGLVYEEEKGN